MDRHFALQDEPDFKFRISFFISLIYSNVYMLDIWRLSPDIVTNRGQNNYGRGFEVRLSHDLVLCVTVFRGWKTDSVANWVWDWHRYRDHGGACGSNEDENDAIAPDARVLVDSYNNPIPCSSSS